MHIVDSAQCYSISTKTPLLVYYPCMRSNRVPGIPDTNQGIHRLFTASNHRNHGSGYSQLSMSPSVAIIRASVIASFKLDFDATLRCNVEACGPSYMMIVCHVNSMPVHIITQCNTTAREFRA